MDRLRTAPLLLACLALAAALAAPGLAQAPVSSAPATIVVQVEGLRNDRGSVVGALYTVAETWLIEGHSAEDCHARITNHVARCVFSVRTAGPVAFAGFHDEDDDHVFDRDVFGFPQEGYAFSNDVRDPFGPPTFADAAFTPPALGAFVVHARYGI
jgi:uncharacterized protein (DUF2141 family)